MEAWCCFLDKRYHACEDLEAFHWRGLPLGNTSHEYALLLPLLLYVFDALLMDCLARVEYRPIVTSLCHPRDEYVRVQQVVECISTRSQNTLILLDVYDALLDGVVDSGCGYEVQIHIQGDDGIDHAVLQRIGNASEDRLSVEVQDAFAPFVHTVSAFTMGGNRKVLLLYYLSSRNTAMDMGPIQDELFRAYVAQEYDVVVGDFNATGGEAQTVVRELMKSLGHPEAADIGTRKWRTPFQTQHTKCGEVTAVTLALAVKDDDTPLERFLLTGESVDNEHPPIVPCAGHFSDHYAAASHEYLVLNCARAQTCPLEFMTDALTDANESLWEMLLDDSHPAYGTLTNVLSSQP